MHFSKIARRALMSVGLLFIAGTSQAATQTYFLQYMTFETGNSPGNTYYFGTPYSSPSSLISNSWCLSCVVNQGTITGTTGLAVLDTITSAVTVTNLEWSLRNFGANFREDSDGTTSVGGSSYIKSYDSCTLYAGVATQYCSATDVRSYAGNWYQNLRADGTTACNNCKWSVALNGEWLTMTLRKPLSASDPVVTGSWAQIGYNFHVVPLPGAVWLMGGALGLLGWVRRRQLA